MVACDPAAAYPARPASGFRRDPDAADVLSGQAHQALVAVASRRLASIRSRTMAAAAATRAAPMAISAICQPGVPAATMVRTWTGAGTAAGATYPAPGSGSSLANAGVASRTAAASRPGLRRAGRGVRRRLTPRCADESPGENAVWSWSSPSAVLSCGRLSRPSMRRLARLAGCAAGAGRPLYGRWVE